jgi:hypothetical protein
MRAFTSALLLSLLALVSQGCTGDVKTTEDSVRLEADLPKVEVGDQPVDLDPRTDGDVDIDTPKKGDT